jgi:DNA-binding CsgD family transcriptional regulator
MKKQSSRLERIKNVWANHEGYLAGHSAPPAQLRVDEILGNLFCPGPFYYYIMDSNTLTFDMVSGSARNLLGIPPESFTLEQLIERIHPDDIPFMQQCEHRIADFLRNAVAPDKVVNYKVSYCLRQKVKDGSYRLFLMQTSTLQTTPEGSLLKVLGVHTDISHISAENNFHLSLLGMNGEPSFFIKNVSDETSLSRQDVPCPFTPRELQVVKLLGEGFIAKEIAAQLHVSVETVITHRKNMIQKTGTKNTAGLVVFCVRAGYI